MEAFEYMQVQVIPDTRSYIRLYLSRQRLRVYHEPPEILFYPGTQLDLGKFYSAQGWEVVSNYLNRAYLFRRRQSDQPTTPDR